MKLEEEATCVAKDGSHLIASPERCGGCSAILTYWLKMSRLAVSKCCHILSTFTGRLRKIERGSPAAIR